MIMSKTVLVTGSTGLLGSATLSQLKEVGYIVESFDGDIQDETSYIQYEGKKYDWVVHTAAMTNVDYCEKNRESCFNTNVTGTKLILDLAKKCESNFLYISTVSVFSGIEGDYKETDLPYPNNYYNLSKYLGERLALEYTKGFVLRTNIIGVHPLGSRGKNFLEWLVDSIKLNKDINLFNDIIVNPLSCWTLADMICSIISKSPDPGVYHVASSTALSKADIGKFVISFHKDYNGSAQIMSVDELPDNVVRPKLITLNSDITSKTLNINMPTLESEIEKILFRLNNTYEHEHQKN